MKYPEKRIAVLILTTLLICSFRFSYAQYAGMGAFRAQQNQQQFMNQQMSMQMMMNGFRFNYSNNKYPYLVVFKDGSHKIIKSSILTDTLLHKNYLLLIDKKFPKSDSIHRNLKIFPEQTSYISRSDDSLTEDRGISTDSCWRFKAVVGAITAYSFLSDAEGRMFDPGTIVSIQFNNGPIVKMDKKNLKQMIINDPKALKQYDKNNFYKAIKSYNRDAEKEEQIKYPEPGT